MFLCSLTSTYSLSFLLCCLVVALSDFLAHSFYSLLLLHSSLSSCFTPFYSHSRVYLLPPTLTSFYSLSLPLTPHLWHSLIHLVSFPLLSLLSLTPALHTPLQPCLSVFLCDSFPGTFLRVYSRSLRFFFPASLSSSASLPSLSSLFPRVSFFLESFFLEYFPLLPFSSFNLEQQLMI